MRPVKTEWWGAGMNICLGRGADFHMAQLLPLPLTQVIPDKVQRAVKRMCVYGYSLLNKVRSDSLKAVNKEEE